MRRYRRINPRPLCSKTHKPHMLITQFSMLITVLNHVNHCLRHAINGHYPLTKLPAGKAETFHALFRLTDWRLKNRPDRSPNHPLSNPQSSLPSVFLEAPIAAFLTCLSSVWRWLCRSPRDAPSRLHQLQVAEARRSHGAQRVPLPCMIARIFGPSHRKG